MFNLTRINDMKQLPRNYRWILLIVPALIFASCGDPGTGDEGGDEFVFLNVAPSTLTYNAGDPTRNVFTVKTNTSWTATVSNSGLVLDRMSGTGEQSVTVTSMTANETYTATITTDRGNAGGAPLTKTVTVSGLGDGQVVFYDDLDKAPQSGNPFLDRWQGFVNATGSGVQGTITYVGQDVSIRSDVSSSGAYQGASGGNSLNFVTDNCSFEVGTVYLPDGQTGYELSFGTCCPNSFTANTLKVYVSANGQAARQLSFTRSGGTGWELVSIPFRFNTGPKRLTFKFEGLRTARIDDIRLTTSAGGHGQLIELDSRAYPWTELPETKAENPNFRYLRYFSKTVQSNKDVRNYTACYDVWRCNPVYVAFPYHSIYYEGRGARTNPDPWRPDPTLAESEQSVIYATNWRDWPWSESAPADGYQYWGGKEGVNPYRFWFGRGHLMRSAERGGRGSELNIQTFYPTNIAPENYRYPDHWAAIEGVMPSNWNCSDTLYCVVGCHYASDNHKVWDANNQNQISSRSKQCTVPTARYKVFLRTRAGNTGKHIAECSASEVISIGFWFEQDFEKAGTYSDPLPKPVPGLREIVFSVDEIERKTGNIFEFFPNAPADAKKSCNISDWPGLSELVD